ncbi:cytochrome c biogenesis CcdA family protein [Nocardioides sp. KR10-350]|uniref:cytochrome c biogenesis CcdA family protein n=1 Tax=Nocardioides cheoyonin TaxID=3156615 RepID=UPI0032B34A99
MSAWFTSTASNGSLLLAVPVALVTGLLSFVSPCTLPMLPGYLSYSTGLSGADLAEGNVRRGRMLLGSVLFVLGFTVVFVLLGLAVGGIASKLLAYTDVANRVLGILCIVMGIAFIGLIPALQRDVRFHKVPAVGLAAAPLLGFLFGLGWTPCNGPTLGVISTLAWNEGTAARGGLLLACYSLGLGIPFVVVALAWRKAMVAVRWLRSHQRAITRVGGALMIVVGLALVTGWWDYAVQALQNWVVSHWEGLAL